MPSPGEENDDNEPSNRYSHFERRLARTEEATVNLSRGMDAIERNLENTRTTLISAVEKLNEKFGRFGRTDWQALFAAAAVVVSFGAIIWNSYARDQDRVGKDIASIVKVAELKESRDWDRQYQRGWSDKTLAIHDIELGALDERLQREMKLLNQTTDTKITEQSKGQTESTNRIFEGLKERVDVQRGHIDKIQQLMADSQAAIARIEDLRKQMEKHIDVTEWSRMMADPTKK